MASRAVQNQIDAALQVLESASNAGIGTTIRGMRIERALKMLRELESQATTEVDLGHIRGRILVVQCANIGKWCQEGLSKKEFPGALYQIEEVLDIWSWLCTRPRHQLFDCVALFRQTLTNVLSSSHNAIPHQDLLQGVQSRISKSPAFSKDPYLVAIHIETQHAIFEDIFHEAIRHFEAGRWAPAMSLLKSKDSSIDVLVELEEKETERASDVDRVRIWDNFELGRAKMVRKDFDMQLAMCRGAQLIHLGDLHFKEAETGEPEDFMAAALLAQDDYRAALSCVSEQDVELEGTALAKLARFYSKVSKIPVTAHQIYLRAVQLASSLAPALPKGSWYQESVDAVQKYRDSLLAEEAKQWASKRQPILEKLSEEMAKLNGKEAKNMSNMAFARFIFKTWPPRTDGSEDPPSDPSSPEELSKKHMLKVIQRYHTDKNTAWGEEWLVMCEEITKAFTARYNVMKGVD